MVARITPTKPVRHFLKEWRLKRTLTQQQLADLLPSGADGKPTGKDQVSRWERNERGMTMDVQAALAGALGIEPQDLYRDPSLSSLDRMLADIPPEFSDEADELRQDLERQIIRTRKLLDARKGVR